MKKIKKLLLCGAICALSLCCAVPVFADKNRDLREAAACGDLYGVKRLIKEGAYVNSKNYDDETPLILALKNKHREVVEYLVENVEGVKCCGAEPMDIAYEKWGTDMMKYLANHGIGTITNANSKFYTSALAGCSVQARFLLKHYKSAISLLEPNDIISNLEKKGEYDFCGLIDEGFIKLDSTLYTIAYYKGYEEVCTKLKKLCGDNVKLDLNSIRYDKPYYSNFLEENKERYSRYKKEFINRAIINEDKEALEALINDGMTNEQLLKEKENRFFKKMEANCADAVETYLENIKKLINMDNLSIEQVDDLFKADAVETYLENIKKLINMDNLSIEQVDDLFEQAFNFKTFKTNQLLNTIKFYLDSGLDINIRGKYGETLLMKAVRFGSWNIVRFLLERGADVTVKNNKEETALKIAKKTSYKDIIKLLKEAEEAHRDLASTKLKKKSIFSKLFSKDKKTNKPTTITKNEETIFQEPIFTPQPNVPAVPTFQNNNSSNINKNFNTLNNNSATKDLFDGIEDDSFFDVLKAIQNGANVNAVNPEDGMTPLMLAAVNGQLEIIKFLIQKHANVNEVFNNKTALKMAKNERIRQELINAGATI